MSKKIDTTQKCVGLKYRTAARITNTKTDGQWIGHVDFDFTDCTVDDLAIMAARSETIKFATRSRKNIGDLRGRESVAIRVKPPGVRERADARRIDADVVADFMSNMDADARRALIDRVMESRDA